MGRSIPVVKNGKISFFYGSIIFHCIYTSQFLYPLPIDGHLGCFHVLATVNNAVVNLGCRYLFKIVISFPSDKCPEVGFLDHMVVPFLIFLRPSILFSIGAVPIYIPTNSAQGFPFLHILTNTFYLLSFFGGGGLKYLFIYFCLHWVFVAAHGLSLVVASGGYSLLRCVGFPLQWLLLLQSTGSRGTGFSGCGSRALERRLSSCGARA